MNDATELAGLVVDRLLAHGIADVVLAPGSRSAPLALELAATADAGLVRLSVRVDERSAGFQALGIARVSGMAAAVLCTSGTAVANLLPVVIEASYAGVPLVCLTADRPPELRNVGANQTIDQVGIFGRHVRLAVDVGAGGDDASGFGASEGEAAVDRALRAALDPDNPGPVQVNLAFREPLVPDGPIGSRCSPRPGMGVPTAAVGGSTRSVPPDLAALLKSTVLNPAGLKSTGPGPGPVPSRGVIIAGDIVRADDSLAVSELAAATGWPVFAEPTGNVARIPQAIAHFPLLLAPGSPLLDEIELVVTVGRFGLSRPTNELVRSAPAHVSVALSGCDRPDPWHTAAAVVDRVPVVGSGSAALVKPDPDWLSRWRAVAGAASRVIERAVASDPWNGIVVAREVASAAKPGDVLLVGASRSVRDVQDFALAPAEGVRVIGNRGASGIDGLVSTSRGAAMARRSAGCGRVIALLGDLAFLHDCGGLSTPRGESEPDLTIVVADNNGGGIFSSLEQGRPEFSDHFERVFGTPPDRDLCAVAEAFGVEAVRVSDRESLAAVLHDRSPGFRVVVAALPDRTVEAALRARIAAEVAAKLAPTRGGTMSR